MSRNITKIVQKQLDQELQAIIDWITPIDYSSQQNDFIESRQPGTGEWLLNSKEFQNWINQKKQTLFCPGIPGAGKTIATSIAVSYLHEKFQEKCDIGIAYLYLNFRRQSEQEPMHILSSLLRQLSRMDSTVHGSVQQLYKKHNPKEGESRPTLKMSPTRPSLEEIVNALKQTIASYSRAYIIIDALDECTDSNLHRSNFMSEIFGLQTRLGTNLFFTSRPIPQIKKYFENREYRTLEIRATDKDMRQYLDTNMPQLPSFIFRATGLEEKIKLSIIEASKGMFLLTRLHLDSLRDKTSVWQVEDTLERLPKGSDAYEQAYTGAMERIQSQKRGFCDLANRVLFWITCSGRPLSTLELQHALAVVDGSSALNPHNLTEIGLMVSVCAGLVEVDEHSDIIRLVHYTVQEYYERTCGTWFPTAQTDIAKTCITYLSFDIFKAGANPTDELFEAGSQSNILYDYAACNWGHHVRISSDPDVNLLAMAFLESEATTSTWNQVTKIYRRRASHLDQEFQNIYGLHMAAYFGLIDPMKALLKKHDPDSEVQGYRSPLHIAAGRGHEAMVTLLLDEGFDLESQDEEGWTPLQCAAAKGREVVVRLLLQKGANIESKDKDGQTPL
ncbi:hypothetical protein CI102_8363, partial [Trichoderma harzianum]